MYNREDFNGVTLSSEEALDKWDLGIDAWNDWIRCQDNFDPEFSTEIYDERSVFVGLVGDAAMALYRKGVSEWNEWVARNPNANVDFSKSHFEAKHSFKKNAKGISFAGFRFPNGYVDFADANFAYGDVDFKDTVFSEGIVYFDRCNFGTGSVIFDEADFSKCIVHFEGTVFGEGKVSFKNCTFAHNARFINLRNVEKCAQFSFEGCSFEKLFTFSHVGKMGGPLDLRRTSLKHDVVVADICCDYKYRRSVLPWLTTAEHPEDSQRFRKLKELAVANRNHAKALEFHALEIQTARGNGTTWWQDGLQFFYWLLSDYGRSVVRPLIGIAVTVLAFAALFWDLRKDGRSVPPEFEAQWCDIQPGLLTALTYSFSNMLAFIPTGRTAKQQGEDFLFGKTVPDEIILLAGTQTVLAVILLFLLGLGLRNTFRV